MLRAKDTRPSAAIGACSLVALFEGLDIQSMGVAAPKIAPILHISPQTMGFILSASTFGLMIGAAIGGWLSDRAGRKVTLLLSAAWLGAFSLASSFSSSADMLLFVRWLAGLGLGGVLPNLIAITTEAAPERIRSTALALVYCGMPAGGAIAAWIASVTSPENWQAIFQVGGIGPLLTIPAVLLLIPGNPRNKGARDRLVFPEKAAISRLFGTRTTATILLWFAYFFTLLAVYLLLNWLPSMMIGKGLSRIEAAHSAILLNVGAVIGGVLLGRMLDLGRASSMLVLTYSGMLLMLGALILAYGPAVPWAAFGTGFFVIGGQLILYAMAPPIYPIEIRGTGIGAAVGVGRAGSILGPTLAGTAIAHGMRPGLTPALAVPGLLLSLPALLFLIGRERLRPIDVA